LIADGGVIEEDVIIENSIIGLRCRVGRGAIIRDSIVMGNDFYETPHQLALAREQGHPPMGVGAGAVVEKAILDKNCRVGDSVHIVNDRKVDQSEETDYGMIRDGIVVVPKQSALPNGLSF
jgi:glucose-1-phosphate adenylyltransferase